MTRRVLRLFVLALLASLTGCGSQRLCCVDEVARHRWDDLPTGRAELLALAEKSVRDDADDKELVRGVMAACRALSLARDDGEAALWAAMGCFELRDRGTVPDWLWQDCVPFSETAADQLPKDARAQYVLALNVGLETQNQNPKDALLNVAWILSALDAALALDEALDDGGPLRVSGLLYLRTPSWPTSIGDTEKALELLHAAAAKYPAHPLNHLALAEALVADGSYQDALLELEAARKTIDPAKHHWRTQRYLKQASELEAKAREGLGEPAK